VLENLLDLVSEGFTALDCADIYTGVESLFGDLRRLCRERLGDETARSLRIHTKLVPDRSDLARVDRAYVETIVDRSLSRLGTDRLDLVQFAWWDYDVPRYVETALWLDELRRAGKIRHIGVTNFDVARLREILEAGVPVVANQLQYSALDHRPERGMTDLCRSHAVGLLCYGTLAGGFLSDRYLGAVDPARDPENRSLTKYRLIIEEYGGWEAFQALLRTLRAIGDETGGSIAQVALRYVLDRPGVAAAVVGMSRAERIREAHSAMDLTLSPAQVERIRRLGAAAPGPVGDCFELERDRRGPHAAVMKYDLNREAG
jgi:aryl-alcohol dehydrogenase-like predicted oxidoreductase